MEGPSEGHQHHAQKNWVLVALCALIGFNILLGILVTMDLVQDRSIKLVSSKFPLLRPDIATLNEEDFSSAQRSLYYRPLRELYDKIIQNQTDIGVYYEDLTTGSWIGVNERRKFVGASLLKTQLAATILRKVEDGTLSLQDEIVLKPEDLDDRYGLLADSGTGYRTTIGVLVQTMLQESDNTAANALARITTPEEWIETRLTMGLPLPDFENQQTLVSPKEYSNIFRTFYLSTYLTREHSQYLLSLLSGTSFNDQLVAGVPEGVTVSHKVGIRSEGDRVAKEFHDCGIVYAEHPYLLCVMVEGRSQAEATALIAKISEVTYQFVVKRE